MLDRDDGLGIDDAPSAMPASPVAHQLPIQFLAKVKQRMHFHVEPRQNVGVFENGSGDCRSDGFAPVQPG